MKATVLLTALLGILLAGCSLRKQAKAAAPPATPRPAAAAAPAPEPPLSIPQTRVSLPQPQELDPASLVTAPTPTEPESLPAAASPARPRRANPPPSQPASPPVASPVPEPRLPVQEIIPLAESKQLLDQAIGRRREVRRILDQLGRRHLSVAQQEVKATILNYLALSDDAEKHNDPRQADAFAERAQILAKELQSGK